MDRTELAALGRETLLIVQRGYYQAPSGKMVTLSTEIVLAAVGTRMYRADEKLVVRSNPGLPCRIEVVEESTVAAAQRLAGGRPLDEANFIGLLNFASPVNPGGGFLRGAKAQEEDLCRCSALYPCLEEQDYYTENRKAETESVLASPRVPFFRDENYTLLERPFTATVITAAAPYAPKISSTKALEATISRRVERVLAVAAVQCCCTLVLGAWGCGAFQNDPRVVAGAFKKWLADPKFSGLFDRVVFAIVDTKLRQPNLSAFREAFGGRDR